jgi:hypothetical protein
MRVVAVPQTQAAASVEAPVTSLIVFLSGLAVTLAGAFIRSCSQGISAEFAQTWCGNAPPSGLIAAAHAHCAGCALVAGGLALVALAPLFIRFTDRQINAQVRK